MVMVMNFAEPTYPISVRVPASLKRRMDRIIGKGRQNYYVVEAIEAQIALDESREQEAREAQQKGDDDDQSR